MNVIQIPRRDFLKSSFFAGSGLVLGFSGFPVTSKAIKLSSIPPYLRIDQDGGIYLGVPSAEMGQGIHTTLAMLVAEELENDMYQFRNIETLHHPDFKHLTFKKWTNSVLNYQFTGASESIRTWHLPFRKLGASARLMLRKAASLNWEVPESECLAENGWLIHSVSGRKQSYGELVELAKKLTPPKNIQLKKPKQFKLLGREIKRWDTPIKTDGSAVFGSDIEIPGMLYGTVKHCDFCVGKIKNIDDSETKKIPGVIDVIILDDQVIVVAETTWTAMQGANLLKIKTEQIDKSINDKNIISQFKNDLDRTGVSVAHLGDINSAISKADKLLELEYLSPMQAHAAMEPLCATANVNSQRCEVWAPIQTQDFAMMVASGVTKLPEENIQINTTYIGGSFGRKFEYDFLLAPLVDSKLLKKPVKITWTRESDTRQDFFRPPSLVEMKFGLNQSGIPVGLKVKIIGPAVSKRWGTPPPWFKENGYDWAMTIGMFDGYKLPNRKPDLSKNYSIPNLKVDFVPSDIQVPLGAWRSIGSSHNIFALESGLDEVAVSGGNDPFELRSKLLRHNSRALAVLERAKDLSDWTKPSEGHFLGMAYSDYLETYQVQVAEISVTSKGKVKVHKITCVADCGQVFNLHIARQQLEGGIIYGLTAALKGEINVKNGQIVQSNFDDYPMIKLKDTPEIKVHFMGNHRSPGGLGEAGTPLIGPAVANAVFAATGKRIRKLPIRRKDLA